MANSMSGFFRQHAKQVGTIKAVVSERFLDPETEKPYEWELRPLTVPEEESIRRECMIPGRDKKNRITQELDQNKYTSMSIAKSVVFPDLESVELQDSYGAMGAEDLIKKMLLSSENIRLMKVFNRVSGIDQSMEEMVDEAKD